MELGPNNKDSGGSLWQATATVPLFTRYGVVHQRVKVSGTAFSPAASLTGDGHAAAASPPQALLAMVRRNRRN